MEAFITSFDRSKNPALTAGAQRLLNEYWKPKLGELKKDSNGCYLIPGSRGLAPMTNKELNSYAVFMGY